MASSNGAVRPMKRIDLYRWHIRDAVTGEFLLTSYLMSRRDVMGKRLAAAP